MMLSYDRLVEPSEDTRLIYMACIHPPTPPFCLRDGEHVDVLTVECNTLHFPSLQNVYQDLVFSLKVSFELQLAWKSWVT